MQSSKYQPLRILIADDHELTRFSLKLLLSQQQNLKVIALAENGQEAINLVASYRPDLVILDLQMPVMNGLIAAGHIKNIAPQTQIIAYSSVEDLQLEVIEQTAPIDTFCAKEVSTEALLDVIKKLGQQALTIAKVNLK